MGVPDVYHYCTANLCFLCQHRSAEMVIKAKNWKEAEDTTLVRAWMAIAQDPVTGNEQRAEHFWDRVHAEFSTHLLRSFDDLRKNDACKNRWQLLQKAVSKFSGCWSAIQRRNDSGATITQKLADAHTLYLQDRGKPFKHVTCWELLKDCQKWRDLIDPNKVCLLLATCVTVLYH